MEEQTSRIIRKWIWLIIFTPIAIFILYIACVGLFARIPSFEELEDPKSNAATELISEDGEILCTYHIENRMFIGYDEISPNVINAAVATEDVRFYEHSGIDFRSLLRVGVKTLAMRNASSGGGSTLTQQLAKSLFPRDTSDASGLAAKIRLVNTKFKEWITAVKLERNYTKNEILTMYLNTILFGSNAFGIRSASETFFSKEPSELNIQEAATLVGMVNKPTRYNPVLNYDRSLERRNHVLNQMNKYDFITDEVCDSLKTLPIELNYNVRDHNSGSAPYFRDMLRRMMNAKYPERSKYYYEEDYLADMESWKDDPLYGWLNKNFKPDGSKYDLDKDGLKIFVTINSRMQRYAEESVCEQLGTNLQPVFFNEMKYKPHRPFARNVPVSTISDLMANARRWSDRYRSMKRDGASEQKILEEFDKKVNMRVFSWKGKGYIDTLMSPNDSIRYYKSFLRAAFIAMEPSTGHVKAYVGGPNYRYFKYDNASQGKRQVGSTIKPFLYTLAMQEGYSPCDRVVDVPVTFIVGDTTWTPKSTDKPEWIGQTVTFKWGLTKSSNNISAYLMRQFGPQAMVDMCRKMGIHSFLDPVPPLCCGAADISVMEMVNAYNTFPSRGVRTKPLFVTKIEDKEGNILGSFAPRNEESISEATAYLMVNLMQGVVNEGTATRLRGKYALKGEIAGKTGTTNDHSDGWFIGYTPRLTAGGWVGAEDRQGNFESLALGGGSNTALPIWGIFMKKVMNDPTLGITDADHFIVPAGIHLDLRCDGSDADATSTSTESFFD